MTGLFIDTGPVVQIRDSNGRVSIEADREPGMAWDGPLAVLVNRGSASASEIFAAAIQDYGRGIIIGEPTFGKGTVQNLFNLDNYMTTSDNKLGQIKLTMAKFFRIDGGSTQLKGVTPDIEMPSFGEPGEYGEAGLDHAMAWSQIEATDYQRIADLSPLLPMARQRHVARRASNEQLIELIDEYQHFEELDDRTTVSLLESERRAEFEANEARREDRFADAGTTTDSQAVTDPAGDDGGQSAADADPETGGDPAATPEAGDEAAEQEEPDVVRTEAARILADLIELDHEQHRLVQVQQPVEGAGGLH